MIRNEPVLILTTGGTFDKVYFDARSAYRVGEPQAPRILGEARVAAPHRVEAVMAKDSLEFTDEDRAAIRDAVMAAAERRVVIVHGTDTLTRTAEALTGVAERTIVLVGARQPARMRETDAPFNLGYALAAAQFLDAGVYVAMNGRVLDAGDVEKDRTTGRFEPR